MLERLDLENQSYCNSYYIKGGLDRSYYMDFYLNPKNCVHFGQFLRGDTNSGAALDLFSVFFEMLNEFYQWNLPVGLSANALLDMLENYNLEVAQDRLYSIGSPYAVDGIGDWEDGCAVVHLSIMFDGGMSRPMISVLVDKMDDPASYEVNVDEDNDVFDSFDNVLDYLALSDFMITGIE